MNRDPAAVAVAIRALMPEGWAWSRRADLKRLRMLEPLGEELAAAEADAMDLLGQIADIRTATTLLSDYEETLGPDPCGRDQLALTEMDRQMLAHQRWTANGSASIPFLMRLARSLGSEIRIEETDPSYAGEMQAGDELIPETERFAWQVHLPATRVIEFVAGGSQAGDALGAIVPSLLECVIRSYAPAHTNPVFVYPEDDA